MTEEHALTAADGPRNDATRVDPRLLEILVFFQAEDGIRDKAT